MNLTIEPPNHRTTQYGPLTKSIDVDEALMLIGLTREHESVAAWQEEALTRLPQASRKRRQEIARDVRRKFLQVEEGQWVRTPLWTLLTAPALDARLKRDLLLAQYLRATPLAWEAIREVALPHAEAGAQPLSSEQDAEIALDEWSAFLEGRLNTTTASTVVKTRNHLTAHLAKFGLLRAQPVPGDRFAKRFYAHFYDPDPRAFWFSLAQEFAEQGWTSRSLEYVSNGSWTRIAYCVQPAYARYAVEEAERAALVVTDFFGSQKQVTFRGPGFVSTVAEAILHG